VRYIERIPVSVRCSFISETLQESSVLFADAWAILERW
jgi:hypothetical protein